MSAVVRDQAVIRVVVIDDDHQIQEALRKAMAGRGELAHLGSAYSVQEGLDLLESAQPDVALIDLGLGDQSGLALIAHIHQNMPNTESLVLTVFGDEAHVMTSIESGASGYLTKDTQIDEIVNRLQQLRAGGSPISPIIARRLLARFRGKSDSLDLSISEDAQSSNSVELSDREREVLELVARGFMQAEIAEMLNVTMNTVSTYVKRTYKKLAVNSRINAINKARALGLISAKGPNDT